MRFSVFSYFIVFSLIICSCSDESAELTTGGTFEIPVVTGILGRDLNGDITAAPLGIPNTRARAGGNSLSTFPNPAQGFVSIVVGSSRIGGSEASPAGSTREVWLVPALLGFNIFDVEGNLLSNQYFNSTFTKVNPVLLSTTLTNNNSTVTLDLRGLPQGAYRVYAKVNDELLWDNILLLNY